MPERLIGAVLKTVERASVPWVRIPPSPPFKRVREGSFLVCSEKRGRKPKISSSSCFGKTGKLYGIQKVIYSKLITTISGGQLKRIGRILIPIPFVSIIVLLSSKIFPVVYLFPYFDGTIIAPQNGKRICPPCKCPASVKFTSCGTSGKISGE